MPFERKTDIVGMALASSLAVASCNTVPSTGASPTGTIQVGQPEVFENADLQAQLDGLRQQLAAVSAVDQPSLIAALSNLQGTSATQTGVSVQALQRGLPQVSTTIGNNASTTTGTMSSTATGATTSGTSGGTSTGNNASTIITGAPLAPTIPASPIPSAPTLPGLAPGTIGVLEQQMQLSSQILGYELLLTGSDFARYTSNGAAKDKLVVGFPVTLNPRAENHDQAAEVQVTYFPPNPDQFNDPLEFETAQRSSYHLRAVCDQDKFTDKNSRAACLQQEASPTIVNILPAERSYNTVVLSSSASTFGLGALIGTVSVGGSFGSASQTEYLLAQQDTLALQANGPRQCESSVSETASSAVDPERRVICPKSGLGVSFTWQFRPVLGSHFVRAGTRRMYVQLAIPYARRPYPNYGGVVQIKTRWRPFDSKKGVIVVGDTPPEESLDTRAVFGHPFVDPLLSSLSVNDVGSGNLLVLVHGTYLIGASVLVGPTLMGPGSPGFGATYNQLQFTATAQSLAQNGATVVASGGVPTPIQVSSLCKYLDERGECYRLATDSKGAGFDVDSIVVEPVSDSSSLVRVKLKRPLRNTVYDYHRYFKVGKDVVGPSTGDRKPDPIPQHINGADFAELTSLPIVVTVGGKTYGLSDQPFQQIENDDAATLSFIASNESLNAAPELTVQRLFGDPASNSLPVEFVPPGRLQLVPFNHEVAARSAPAQKKGDSNKATASDANSGSEKPVSTNCYEKEKVCDFLLVGVMTERAEIHDTGNSCAGPLTISFQPGAVGLNARKVRIPECYRQLTLDLPASESGLHPVAEIIALSIAAPPPMATAKNLSKILVQTPSAPNFTLTRAVQDVEEYQGVVYLAVGIQKLKDQSATLTVSNADVASATDGSGAALNVQAGNQVTVTQDTNIIFAVRNVSSGLNIAAEGKTGGASTGKVSFDGPFNVTHRAVAAKPAK